MSDSAMVSTPLQSVPRRNFAERSGGKRPFTNVPIWNHASRYKNTRRSAPVPMALQMIRAMIPATTTQE